MLSFIQFICANDDDAIFFEQFKVLNVNFVKFLLKFMSMTLRFLRISFFKNHKYFKVTILHENFHKSHTHLNLHALLLLFLKPLIYLGYYCVAGGASNYHTIAHMQEAISEKNFRAKVHDVTHELGVLSIQGQTHLLTPQYSKQPIL